MAHDDLTIGDVARRAGVATSAVRFYESEGLIRSSRTGGGQRRFGRDVLRRLAFIRAAQRVGAGLDEIRTALAGLPEQRTPTPSDWSRLSQRWAERLDERIELLQQLRDDLSSCIGCGCLSFGACKLYNPDDVAAGLGDGPRYLFGNSSAEALARGGNGVVGGVGNREAATVVRLVTKLGSTASPGLGIGAARSASPLPQGTRRP